MKKKQIYELFRKALDAQTPEDKQKIKDDLLFDLLGDDIEKEETETKPLPKTMPPNELIDEPLYETKRPPVIEEKKRHPTVKINGLDPQLPKSFFHTKKFLAIGGIIATLVTIWYYFAVLAV